MNLEVFDIVEADFRQVAFDRKQEEKDIGQQVAVKKAKERVSSISKAESRFSISLNTTGPMPLK